MHRLDTCLSGCPAEGHRKTLEQAGKGCNGIWSSGLHPVLESPQGRRRCDRTEVGRKIQRVSLFHRGSDDRACLLYTSRSKKSNHISDHQSICLPLLSARKSRYGEAKTSWRRISKKNSYRLCYENVPVTGTKEGGYRWYGSLSLESYAFHSAYCHMPFAR